MSGPTCVDCGDALDAHCVICGGCDRTGPGECECSGEHHVEMFRDDDTKAWGWQCFKPDCKAKASGLLTFHDAEVAANLHADTKARWPRDLH